MKPELCEDEGCPQHGTPHVCVRLSPQARHALALLTSVLVEREEQRRANELAMMRYMRERDQQAARAEKAEAERDQTLARLAVICTDRDAIAGAAYETCATAASIVDHATGEPETEFDRGYDQACRDNTDAIRNLTPAAAEAALQRVVDAAVHAERERCAEIAALRAEIARNRSKMAKQRAEIARMAEVIARTEVEKAHLVMDLRKARANLLARNPHRQKENPQ